jgi:hypothetical protein
VRFLYVFGALLVRPDLDLGVELSPELEVDLGHLDMANKVPRDERIVELCGLRALREARRAV